MSYLLDTCVVSERLRKRPAAKVVKWLDRQEPGDLHLSVLTVGEIEKGLSLLPEGAKRERLQSWLREDLMPFFEGRLHGVGVEEAAFWGRLAAARQLAGRGSPVVDGLVAATALAHQLTVATRNVEDFSGSGVSLYNPWTDEWFREQS